MGWNNYNFGCLIPVAKNIVMQDIHKNNGVYLAFAVILIHSWLDITEGTMVKCITEILSHLLFLGIVPMYIHLGIVRLMRKVRGLDDRQELIRFRTKRLLIPYIFLSVFWACIYSILGKEPSESWLIYPIPDQLWFLRDMLLVSWIVLFFWKKFPLFIVLCLLFALNIFDFFHFEMAIFASFALLNDYFSVVEKKWIAVVVLVTALASGYFVWEWYEDNFVWRSPEGRYIVMVFMFFVTRYFLMSYELPNLGIISKSGFFLYLFHQPLMGFTRHLLLSLEIQREWVYPISFILVVCSCSVAFLFLKLFRLNLRWFE